MVAKTTCTLRLRYVDVEITVEFWHHSAVRMLRREITPGLRPRG